MRKFSKLCLNIVLCVKYFKKIKNHLKINNAKLDILVSITCNFSNLINKQLTTGLQI